MHKNFTNIIIDNSEILLDSLIENEVLKEIPVIGTSINLIKGFKNVRDQIYLGKLKYFLENISDINDIQKNRLKYESIKDEKRRVKFGEALITVIEQSDSLVKIKYLAVAFDGFLNEDIDNKEFRHICHAINKGFVDDLIEIVEEKNPKYEVLKSNVAIGLADALDASITADLTGGNITYTLSGLGSKFRDIWKKYK